MERPILFKSEMVRAIFSGSKTQTRRLVKPMRSQKWLKEDTLLAAKGAEICTIKGETWAQFYHPKAGEYYMGVLNDEKSPLTCIKAPFQIGDTIWVKETFQDDEEPDNYEPIYKADFKESIAKGYKWKPSLFMPRKYARLFLKVESVRIERLQDISEYDAKSEGTPFIDGIGRDIGKEWSMSYAVLWNSINGAESWNQNPFVWVYDFARIP